MGRRDDLERDEYYAEFLPLVVSMLAAKGGAIWTASGMALTLSYQVGFRATGLRGSRFENHHGTLLLKTLRDGEPRVVPPDEDYGEDGGNPTDSLLLLSPIKVSDRIIALVEVYQRATASPNIHAGYKRFLIQMCELAGESLALRRTESRPPGHELDQPVQKPKRIPWWKFWKWI